MILIISVLKFPLSRFRHSLITVVAMRPLWPLQPPRQGEFLTACQQKFTAHRSLPVQPTLLPLACLVTCHKVSWRSQDRFSPMKHPFLVGSSVELNRPRYSVPCTFQQDRLPQVHITRFFHLTNCFFFPLESSTSVRGEF